MRHPAQTQWIATCDGAFVNPDDVVFVSEVVDGVMLVKTLHGLVHRAPAVKVPGVMSTMVWDNDVLLAHMAECDSDDCEDEDSDCGEEDSGADDCDSEEHCEAPVCKDAATSLSSAKYGVDDEVEKGTPDLVRVAYSACQIDAVYAQCGDPDDEGDHTYCLLLSNGEHRRVFCPLPVPEFMAAVTEAACGTFTPVAPAMGFSMPVLDGGEPCFVVAYRMDRVSCYGGVTPVVRGAAFVDVGMRCGADLARVWCTGPALDTLHAITQAGEEPPSKRRCLRPRD
jgi:hypothetical protein